MPALKIDTETTEMTYKEYQGLPEGTRVEVINGEVYDMASPSRTHQLILRELMFAITSHIRSKKGGCEVFPAPFDVVLKKKPLTIVQPDIFVVCDKNKTTEKQCNGAPDWIIEIASPSNFSHDYIEKLNLYHAAGVREYWIVNPDDQAVIVYEFAKSRQKLSTYTFRDTVPVGIYEEFSIDFSEIAASLDL